MTFGTLSPRLWCTRRWSLAGSTTRRTRSTCACRCGVTTSCTAACRCTTCPPACSAPGWRCYEAARSSSDASSQPAASGPTAARTTARWARASPHAIHTRDEHTPSACTVSARLPTRHSHARWAHAICMHSERVPPHKPPARTVSARLPTHDPHTWWEGATARTIHMHGERAPSTCTVSAHHRTHHLHARWARTTAHEPLHHAIAACFMLHYTDLWSQKLSVVTVV